MSLPKLCSNAQEPGQANLHQTHKMTQNITPIFHGQINGNTNRKQYAGVQAGYSEILCRHIRLSNLRERVPGAATGAMTAQVTGIGECFYMILDGVPACAGRLCRIRNAQAATLAGQFHNTHGQRRQIA